MAKHLYEVTYTKDGSQEQNYVLADDIDKAIKKIDGTVIRVNLVSESIKE